jgi:hypothetical protein
MARTPKQPEHAPVTFDAFTKALLADWYDMPPAASGDVTSSPRDAAAKALYAACVTHKAKPGTIMLACSGPDVAREAMGYLRSMTTDQPQISSMVKTIGSDEVAFRGGTKILCTPDPTRRPPRLLATVRLAATEPDVSDEQLARTILNLACETDEYDAELEERLNAPAGYFAAIRERAQIEREKQSRRQELENAERQRAMQEERDRIADEWRARNIAAAGEPAPDNVVEFPTRWLPAAPWRS